MKKKENLKYPKKIKEIFNKRVEILNNFDFLFNNKVLNLDFIKNLISNDKIMIRLFIKMYFKLFKDKESAEKFLKTINIGRIY